MKKIQMALILALAVGLLLAAAGMVPTLADEPVTTEAIAGTWYGNMHFSTGDPVEKVQLVIPADCAPGDVCGYLRNFSVECTWELTFDSFSAARYQYHFSDTLAGQCPAGSAGSLTLLANGRLYREHTTPQFTATGILGQRPHADR